MAINVCSTLAAVLLLAVQSRVSPGMPPFRGHLFGVVSRLEPADLVALRGGSGAPAPVRARVARFVDCASAFKSRLAPPTEFFGESARPHQGVLERALACGVAASNAAELAAGYVEHATILYEWEGLHTSPLEEAAYAEHYLLDHPTSPLAPMLELFVGARMRCAFELLDGSLTDTEMVSLAERYRVHLARARRDPLAAVIAADLDGMAFVVRDTGKHPRDVARR